MVDASPVTPPARQNAKAKALAEFLSGLFAEGGAKVGVVEPDEGESVRGLKASITRQAKAMNKAIQVWDESNNIYVAIKPEDGQGPKRRGRPRTNAQS